MKCLKIIKPLDWVILAIAVVLLTGTDFEHMTTFDQVYVVAVGVYAVLLIIRVFVEYGKSRHEIQK